MVQQRAPDWMPDAIPTEFGWQDPRTGEIIIGMTGLNLNPILEEKEETPVTPKVKKKTSN